MANEAMINYQDEQYRIRSVELALEFKDELTTSSDNPYFEVTNEDALLSLAHRIYAFICLEDSTQTEKEDATS